MLHYKLTKVADQKLEKIIEYTILNFGEVQADKYYTRLHEIFELLGNQPNIGRPFFEYHRGVIDDGGKPSILSIIVQA